MAIFSCEVFVGKKDKDMKKAITLIEVMITIIFLIVVLSSLLAAYVNCLITNEFNRNRTVGITHAQYVMEEIKNQYTLSAIRDKVDNWDTDSLFASNMDPLYGSRLPLEDITQCCFDADASGQPCFASCPADNTLFVRVATTWKDREIRGDRSINLETAFVEP